MVRVRRLRTGRGPLEKAGDVEDELAVLSEDKERATVNVDREFALSPRMESCFRRLRKSAEGCGAGTAEIVSISFNGVYGCNEDKQSREF